ncbi:MAG: sensor histidine kinase, partial [Acutalibacteraceae bacterium]
KAMKRKLSNQFLANFWVIFLLTVFATVLAFALLSFASGLISDFLTKNRFSAEAIIKEDYTQINTTDIVKNGGGVQIVDKDYRVVFSSGLDTIKKDTFTVQEFTAFLTESKIKPYYYDILYQPQGEFWLIVTFPTSIRIDFKLVHNNEAPKSDLLLAGRAIAFVLVTYILILLLFTFIYSRVTAAKITTPLKKLCEGTRLLREGDYSARVDLRLKNEFAELQDTFNDMARRIETETALRKKSEENRRRLILDISHDLKNPLSSIQGYAELLCQKSDSPELKAIYQNSLRANRLLNEMFELSKMDSPDFSLKLNKTDICEALRQICAELVPQIESKGFNYKFDIPDKSIFVMLDYERFGRIIQNLADNALRYNPSGTTISVELAENDMIEIYFADDGIGISKDLTEDIFKPFVRADDARSFNNGGSGLGLSIAKKIANAHGGDLTLCQDGGQGSKFKITIPKI